MGVSMNEQHKYVVFLSFQPITFPFFEGKEKKAL